MALKYITEAEIKDKNVLMRVDFNVPLKDGKIQDSSRIDAALKTINYLLENGARKLILMSHLGRPKGKKDLSYSLEPVANYLAEVLKQDVILTEDCLDKSIKELIKNHKEKIIVLENLRFHNEETDGDENFARKLSEYADLYVNDAFGVSHRAHASVHTIVKFFKNKSYGGFLIQNEIKSLSKIIEGQEKPFVAIIGGAKVSDKIKTIERLLTMVDKLLIGGAMCYPFLKAKGFNVGTSLCNDEDLKLAQGLLKSSLKERIILPVDHIIAKNLNGEGIDTTIGEEINEECMGLDIGPRTIKEFEGILSNSKTIFWNGPMGYFENTKFSVGTNTLAKIIGETSAFTVVGGGDSVSAIKNNNLEDNFSHISTGGGASLEFIEKGQLPGINALKFGIS